MVAVPVRVAGDEPGGLATEKLGSMSTNEFAALGVDPDIVEALSERGITSPFDIQTMTIPDSLSRRDVCGKAKTGS